MKFKFQTDIARVFFKRCKNVNFPAAIWMILFLLQNYKIMV
jgi:hypothetical protein